MIPNILDFSIHIKTERMTQFDIFHVFIENSVNSELCFFWALLKPAKIWNLSKTSVFEQLKKQVPVNSKKCLIWTFWDYKTSWSKKSTPIQPRSPVMYFPKMQFLRLFRPLLQMSLGKPTKCVLGKSDKMRYIPKVLGRAKPGQRTNDYNHYDHP